MSRPDSAALAERYRSDPGSGEYAAVTVLLGHEPIAAAAKFCRHASAWGIDWDAVLAETWIPAERLLVATAAGLWSGRRTPVDISRAAFLDDDQFAVWNAMLTAHRTGQAPAVPAAPGGDSHHG